MNHAFGPTSLTGWGAVIAMGVTFGFVAGVFLALWFAKRSGGGAELDRADSATFAQLRARYQPLPDTASAYDVEDTPSDERELPFGAAGKLVDPKQALVDGRAAAGIPAFKTLTDDLDLSDEVLALVASREATPAHPDIEWTLHSDMTDTFSVLTAEAEARIALERTGAGVR
jgi:hypothetical protein